MEYERIRKVQAGLISPSKLRMKLVGPHRQKKKDGSNCNSSRTSPARLDDSEFVNNSLLSSTNEDFSEEVTSSSEVPTIKSDGTITNAIQSDGNLLQIKELPPGENRRQSVSKGESSNSSSVHPVRACEDENLDYDSTSSFEFHKGERSLHHSGTRCFSRAMSSKWNDAEKWIMNRQNMHPNISKKNNLQNHMSRSSAAAILVRVAPEFITGSENKPSGKRVEFCQSPSQQGFSKFAFTSNEAATVTGQKNGPSSLIDMCHESKDFQEIDTPAMTEETSGNNPGAPAIRSVSMRDTGTEMTPIPSQEPSRSATPLSATSPLRTPTPSMPSTPRIRDPTPTPIRPSSESVPYLFENGKKELSEQELKLKTRKEIVALGVRLGKTNIAAWASKDEKERGIEDLGRNSEHIDYERRAAVWEEAEKSKHAARFKREELKIQAWESRQRAKLEAEVRKMEARIEQTRAHAQAMMIKRVALARQKADEKRAKTEAKKIQQAEKTAAQAEYIRQTGRIPTSPFLCCSWS
ncbi:uncharacterized protein LOC127247288 [Andrographis paniculata]|uniref:uncharacterized protein LOC127247288 n=1 Tax=Andrographis paniculata TaxID=175694 RepID=UPI0021E7B341|nr:uncharacterized protein LOC127247288 [Andrographis paniculata]